MPATSLKTTNLKPADSRYERGTNGGQVTSIAEFERDRISERTKEGLEAARKRGRVGGRPPALSLEQKAEVRKMREEGRSIPEIARLFEVSQMTVRRA